MANCLTYRSLVVAIVSFIALCYFVQWRSYEINNAAIVSQVSGHACGDRKICCSANGHNFDVVLSTLKDMNYSKNAMYAEKYLLLTPSLRLKTANVSILVLCRLALILEDNKWLGAVSGKSGSGADPTCNVIKRDWTLYLYTNYSHFASTGIATKKKDRINVPGIGDCHSCTVLPSPILVRTAMVRNWISSDNATYARYGNGLQLALSLYLNGSSAYCPAASIINSSAVQQRALTCNGLGSEWDQKFVFMHELLKAYRIVKPTGEEAWLNCIYSFDSWNKSLPTACANWLYRYVEDAVDILAMFGFDYRLVFGTALGAIRDQDVIPWTADIDIVPLMPGKEYYKWEKTYDSKLANISSMRYDYTAWDGKSHLYPLRMIPRCPVIVDKDARTPAALMVRISAAFSSSSFRNGLQHWRSVPYVDIYEPGHLAQYRKVDPKNVLLKDKFDTGQIRNRTFKLITDSTGHITASYGSSWRNPPNAASSFHGIVD